MFELLIMFQHCEFIVARYEGDKQPRVHSIRGVWTWHAGDLTCISVKLRKTAAAVDNRFEMVLLPPVSLAYIDVYLSKTLLQHLYTSALNKHLHGIALGLWAGI